ncbi:S8 family serine peptidase [Paenisporosarcina sp. OV554]|uniref:S8 family serine peptidase n=1 Tax=Paenisporosarcina sp. OV554 TaxID=2135694 RepID=UPI000D339846|nr:S8 family serine peptidase [Paenisporosarcina sp. OV554]PUB05481.1 subtilisin family serine protease [Paenisporosarcina sp. OV554]
MKRRNKKILNVIMTGVLASSFMTSYLIPQQKSYAMTNSAESILDGLSQEQRQSVKRLTPQEGFVIDPSLLSLKDKTANIIVEFKTEPFVNNTKQSKSKEASKDRAEKISGEQAYFKERLVELFQKKDSKQAPKQASTHVSAQFEIKQTFQNVFNGMAMTIPTNQINTLLETGVVKRIWKDNVVQLPKGELVSQDATTGKVMPPALPHLGVDKLHNEDVKGQGIKVGVLDTGIDYNHPDLKDVYKGGYDFVDNDSDPMESTPADRIASGDPEFIDGRPYITEHGTHVSGTIASNPKNDVEYAMTGVAPNVDLYAYRVLGPFGSGSDSGVIAGIEKAVEDGMDVINLSLGNSSNNSLNATSVAINNAAIQGVVPVIAGGNAGPGPSTLGSPGTSPLAITVGASDVPTDIPTVNAYLGDVTVPNKLMGHGLGKDYLNVIDKDYQVVEVGIGTEEDYSNKNVSGKVALIARGTLAFDEKIRRAHEKGAVAVLIYNNVDGEIPFFLGENYGYVPTFKMLQSDGTKLVNKLTTSPSTTIKLSDFMSNMTTGDELADFSSRGPVINNFDIKPDVVAPGVSTFSTVPEYINSPEDGIDYSSGYASLSGTSMATPHVAGVAALLLQSHPNYTVADVKAALMNTADPLKGRTYNVNEVGAGRVDAYEAVHNTTLFEVQNKTITLDEEGFKKQIDDISGSIPFGSIAQTGEAEKRTTAINIKNSSSEKETYNTRVEFLTIDGVSKDASKSGVTLQLPSSIEVNRNESKSINAQITIPANAEKGIYEGYIYIENESKTAEYQIPFHVRYSQSGFEKVEFYKHAITNDLSNFHPYIEPFTPATFKLNSEMKTIDVVVSDLDGKPIGLYGTFDMEGAPVDTDYMVFFAFTGVVKYFTGDPEKPLSLEYEDLKEGKYIISYVGHGVDGKTYKVDNDMVVDNTAPTVKYDKKFGIHEISEEDLTTENNPWDGLDYNAYWVHGNIHDDTIDYLKSRGHDVSQERNTVNVYQDSYWPTAQLFPNEDGDFKFGVLPDEYKNYPTNLRMYTYDYATAGNPIFPEFTIINKGAEYATLKPSTSGVRLGTEFINTFKMNNPKNLTSAKVSIDLPHYYKVVSVNASKQLTDLASKNKWSIRVAKPEIRKDMWSDFTTFAIDIYDKKTKMPVSINSDINLLDIELKVIDDQNYYGGSFNFQESSYLTGEGETTNTPTFAEGFKFISKHSMLNGYYHGEALSFDNYDLDFSKLGVTAYVIDKKGKQYRASISENGWMTIEDIPALADDYTVVVDIPGHFLYRKKIKLSRTIDGEVQGVYYNLYTDTAAAGDINGDKVIDIYDAKLVANKAGETGDKLKADLNKDGVVDITDFNYVEKNFMTSNPYVHTDTKPVEKIGEMTLEELKKSFN